MLDDLKKTLWATADKLRANMDAAEYKHLVLGLIFVKYISDTFAARRTELRQRLLDPQDDYFYGQASAEDIDAELEDRDYYREVNVFWVPEAARWEALRSAVSSPTSASASTKRCLSSRPRTPSSRASWTSALPAPSCQTASSVSWWTWCPPSASASRRVKRATCWARSRNTSWACSPAPKASAAASSTRRAASSRRWWPCWRRTMARSTTPAADRAACSCRAKNSSKRMAARSATWPSTGRKRTPPPGAWRR